MSILHKYRKDKLSSDYEGLSTTMKRTKDISTEEAEFTQLWNKVRGGLDKIMRLSSLTVTEYSKLYTDMFDGCTKVTFGARAPLSAGSEDHSVEHQLYAELKRYLHGHCQAVLQNSAQLQGMQLVTYYVKQWDDYTFSARVIARLFRYLDRFYVPRKRTEARSDILSMYNLALATWKEQVFCNIDAAAEGRAGPLTTSVIGLLKQHRLGEDIEVSMVRRCLQSYTLMDIADSREEMQTYRQHFERYFLQHTIDFYTQESVAYLADNTMSAYITKAFTRLSEEEIRADLFLHPSSKKVAIHATEQALISIHEAAFQIEFSQKLQAEDTENLAKQYNILDRLPEGLNGLRELYQQHVLAAGRQGIQELVAVSKEVDSRAYVSVLLHVCKGNRHLCAVAFRDDHSFIKGLDLACKAFVNMNAVTGTSSAKTPELLAKFSDLILKKGSKVAIEEDIMGDVRDVLVLFRYIDDKDVFQKFYAKLLAKRLVHETSVSEEAEAEMISQLKEACGSEYTTKLQKMFQDITLSKELNESFKEHTAHVAADNGRPVKSESTCETKFLALGASAWPVQETVKGVIIPPELQKPLDRFKQFYAKKYSGRKLTVHYGLSRNELRTLFTSKHKYILTTSSIQAIILLQFNEIDSHSLEEMSTVTGLTTEQLKPQLDLLVKLQLLTSDDGQYDLNLKFTSKKLRVPCNQAIQGANRAEAADVMKTIDEDRRFLIQAVLVRIMKARRTMRLSELVNEAVVQLSNRFTCKVSDVKKNIDTLIEREYLERESGTRDVLNYLA